MSGHSAAKCGSWTSGWRRWRWSSTRPTDTEKLPFFAALGVREVIVIDHDTKRTQIFRLARDMSSPGSKPPVAWPFAEIRRVDIRLTTHDASGMLRRLR